MSLNRSLTSNSPPMFLFPRFGFHVPAGRALNSNENVFEPYYKQSGQSRKVVLSVLTSAAISPHPILTPDLKHKAPVPALGKLLRLTVRCSGEVRTVLRS